MDKNSGIVVRIGLLMMFLGCSWSMMGQFHEDVFPGESGSQLIAKLRLEYRPATVLEYREARIEMYSKIYNVNDSVECVYSGYKLALEPDNPDPIGSLSRNGSNNGINCEHTFPQSKGAGSGNARSDMHHLFPTRAFVNTARLNYAFEEINDRQTLNWYIDDMSQTSIPTVNRDGYSEQGFDSFEPKEAHKGNVARAVFYFYTVYREVADSDFFGDMRQTLCEWHYQDAVDSLEWVRNAQIASYQDDKRNPYVLDCSLAARTYCPDVAEMCSSVSNKNILGSISNLYPNPTTNTIHLELNRLDSEVFVQVINSLGQYFTPSSVRQDNGTYEISTEGLGNGTYQLLVMDKKTGEIAGRTSFVLK